MDILYGSSSDWIFWASAIFACLLGAMSPGPSLALIVNHSVSQGKVAGLCAASAHGLGIALFAFLTAFGLVVAVDKNPVVFDVIQFAGSLFLLYMAVKFAFASTRKEPTIAVAVQSSPWAAARDGFLIALVNPKILVFFTALFSQFVRPESEAWEKLALTAIAGGVDALWYILVVLLLSQSGTIIRFQRNSWILDKVFSFILFIISIQFMASMLRANFV